MGKNLAQVGVYRYSTLSTAPADFYIEKTEARRLIKDGDAISINRCKAIRLRYGFEVLQAGSLECNQDFVLKRTGKWYAEAD